MLMIYNKQHVEYLEKIHKLAIKEWFDIMLGSVWVFWSKIWNEYSMITPDITDRNFYTKVITEEDKEWNKFERIVQKMLSDTDLILSTYHHYLEFISHKWITLPKP